MLFQGKLMIKIQKNGKKPHFGPDLGPLGPNSGRQTFFSKIWLRQSLDVVVNYHHLQSQKKTNDPILRKFSDGRTDGDRQTEKQTEESDYIRGCSTNFERPVCLNHSQGLKFKYFS